MWEWDLSVLTDYKLNMSNVAVKKGKIDLGNINEIIESRSQRVILLFYSVWSDSIWITMSNFGHNWSKRNSDKLQQIWRATKVVKWLKSDINKE